MREVISAPVAGLDLRQEYGHHQSPAIRARSELAGGSVMALRLSCETAIRSSGRASATADTVSAMDRHSERELFRNLSRAGTL